MILSFKRRRKTFLVFFVIFIGLYYVLRYKLWQDGNADSKRFLPTLLDGQLAPVIVIEKPELTLSLRLGRIKSAFEDSWQAYKTYAWGKDELQPLTRTGATWMNCALTMVDALDSLILFDMTDQYKEAKEYVLNNVAFDYDNDHVNVFETTIRLLGGLVSIHNMDPDPRIVDKLKTLGNKLVHAFETFSGLPYSDINLHDGSGHKPRWTNSLSLSEISSIQLEFNELTRITGDEKYSRAAMKAIAVILRVNKQRKLLPIMINFDNGVASSRITLGARGDSYYEYLLKLWVQTGRQSETLKQAYIDAVSAIKSRLTARSFPNNFLFVGEISDAAPGLGVFSPKMDHLVCFLPGTLAYGVLHGMPSEHLEMARELMHGCYQMYNQTATRLSPEIVIWNVNDGMPLIQGPKVNKGDFYIKPADGHNLLRPETVESLFYLYRITNDSKYQDWGWKIFEAFDRYGRVDPSHTDGKPSGFASIEDVTKLDVSHRNKMESFWLAETLKYFWLLFQDRVASRVDLKQWVFNTEAHPFKLLDRPEAISLYHSILSEVFATM